MRSPILTCALLGSLLSVSLGCSVEPLDAAALRQLPEQAGAAQEGRVARAKPPPPGNGAADMEWVLLKHGMHTARRDHTSTPLLDGHVLVAGGFDPATKSASKSTEWFDPTSASWEILQPMNVARLDHTATVLEDGRMLVAGGEGGRTSELFDPEMMTWTLVAHPMNAARSGHTATALHDFAGNEVVLVTGGEPGGTAELFHPDENIWTPTALMSGARFYHTATLLPPIACSWSAVATLLSARPLVRRRSTSTRTTKGSGRRWQPRISRTLTTPRRCSNPGSSSSPAAWRMSPASPPTPSRSIRA